MKLELDFEDMEAQWGSRQLDLFPWFDGLFALLRTKEAILRETEKRLSKASVATKVQFLSSDDRNNVKIARETIKKVPPEKILPILLYSIEKINKKDYLKHLLESLVDFDPMLSIGYLIGYLNLRQMEKNKIFKIVNLIFIHLNDLFPTSDDKEVFLNNFFKALEVDLKERVPKSKKLKSIDEFEKINLDLEVMQLIFNKISGGDYIGIVEKHMQQIGKEVIISLSGLPFDFKDKNSLVGLLKKTIPYIALMRLSEDRPFLKSIILKIKKLDIQEDEKEAIIKKAEAAIKSIDNPKKCIHELLDYDDTFLHNNDSVKFKEIF